MRRSSLLLFSVAIIGFAPLRAAELAAVQTVYVMQMSHGMDQYLANRLTNGHVFRIVTDPKQADAILTDHIGETFQQDLETLMPSPEPVKKVAPPPPAKDPKDKSATPLLPVDTETKLPTVRSTFGASKGTLFLVDPKSHQVLWSTYDPARSSDSKEMDRTASDIVSRLKKDLNPKK
jgi:hypothetical protein